MMTKQDIPQGVEVAVEENEDGAGVRLVLGTCETVLRFSPQEARALASQLIQAVYQAEVRGSLQRNRGRGLAPAARRVVEAPFPGSQAAPAGQ